MAKSLKLLDYDRSMGRFNLGQVCELTQAQRRLKRRPSQRTALRVSLGRGRPAQLRGVPRPGTSATCDMRPGDIICSRGSTRVAVGMKARALPLSGPKL
jgi:hypothetical protein